MKNTRIVRRDFIKTGIAGAAAIAAAGAVPSVARAGAVKPAGERFAGLKMGIASYSLRKFPLDQAVAMTKQAGVRYITLKDFHLAMKSTREERQQARRTVEAGGLVLMGGGVIYMKNNVDQIRAAFEYAKDAGMPTIVCSPDPDALDNVERLAKEYDIMIAIHNHGPGDDKYPSPMDVLRMVKDRDSRMGICMDVGHVVRINQDPVPVMRACAKRLYDFHIKDVTAPTEKGGAVEAGKGVIDLVAVLRELVKMKFSYHVALEYEAQADNPMPGITQSFAYFAGVLDALQS